MTLGSVGTITTLNNQEGNNTVLNSTQNYRPSMKEEAQNIVLPEGNESDTRTLRQIQDELVKDTPSITLIKQLLMNLKQTSPQLLKIAFNIFSNPLMALSLSYDLFMKED